MEKQYNHHAAEQTIRQKWERDNTYKQTSHDGPLWTIDTPPPTVSGSLHIGHIFSYTQTDIIARYKRMSGYSVFYPFGFDDNGLPTEKYIEKKCGIQAHELGRSKFIELCLKETEEIEKQFKGLWQRIGLSVNWERCYSTISSSTRALSQRSFIELVQKGFIYRRYEPALYCTSCRTSVAQAELDDATIASTFNDIIFKDEQNNDLIISTTRPELLASCVALFFNPADTRYQHLAHGKAIVPLYNKTVPILADETIDINKGTGLVMCCTFGDKNDILWYKKHALPYLQTIGIDGKFNVDSGPIAGMRVPQARELIITLLQEKQLLLKQKPIEHNVSVHERCKKEIEFIMLPQWFLNILEHKKELIAIADQINWYPAFMKSRYVNWVENLNWDWCLSRQRFYGIPFPVWHIEGTDQFLLPPTDKLPIDPQEVAFPGEIPEIYQGKNLIPDTDVMDTWNSSSITPYICYQLFSNKEITSFDDPELAKFLPMQMRPQAHDIIRTWAFYTIVKSWMHNKQIPWHNIVISGHVLADSKEKLSKSKEQKSLSPEHLLTQYPADVIRYWTASGNLGNDIAFSETQLKIGAKLVTKLWNAFKFINEHTDTSCKQECSSTFGFLNTWLSKLFGSDNNSNKAHNSQQVPAQLGLVNEWLLHEATETYKQYQLYFEKNEFGLALGSAEQFFWHTFCDNYLELVKDQFFNPDKYTQNEIAATRWTLHHVGLRILQLFAPYLPFITETLYSSYNKDEACNSIHRTTFAKIQTSYNFPAQAATMQYILQIISQVRALKTKHQLSLRTELQKLNIYLESKQVTDVLKTHEQLLKGATKALVITYIEQDIEASALYGQEHNLEAQVKVTHSNK